MTRYSTIEDVNASLAELEENDRVVATERTNNEKLSETEKTISRASTAIASVNGQSFANGIEENGELHDETVGETESDSDSGTVKRLGHDYEESDEENNDEESESEDDYAVGVGPGSDEEDEVHVRQKAPEVDPQEAADFDRELRALMQAWFKICFDCYFLKLIINLFLQFTNIFFLLNFSFL